MTIEIKEETKSSASIIEQVKAGQVEVNHQAEGFKKQTAVFKLPAHLCLTEEVLFDEQELINHLKQHGVLHAIIHKGIAQDIICVRAKARPSITKTDKNPPLDTPARHKLVSDYKPNLLPRPQAIKLPSIDDQAEMIKKLSPEKLQELLLKAGVI